MNYRLLKSLGFGVGSALIAMAVFPIIVKAAKPVVKGIIKTGINMKDQTKEACSDSKDQD